jgi:peroxiredoxin
MSQQLYAALEEVFQEVRARDIPLGERLAIIADKVRELSPSYSNTVDGFVCRLEQAEAGSEAPKVGDRMPNFILPDDQGRLVQLEQLLEKAPVIVAFLRGHWCPYCRMNAVGLAEIEEAIKPVQIVAISAQTQEYSCEIKAEARASFPFLTDIANGYALSLGLSIWVDDTMSALISSSGWDVPRYQKQDGWILPIPSVFVVRQDGLISARHVDPDYRRRMELDALRAAAKAALA